VGTPPGVRGSVGAVPSVLTALGAECSRLLMTGKVIKRQVIAPRLRILSLSTVLLELTGAADTQLGGRVSHLRKIKPLVASD